MRKSYRRYEVLLPLKFNDGRDVPNGFIGTTLQELRTRFKAVTSETQVLDGTWSHEGQEYHDQLIRVFVDVEDEPDARQYFEEFKDLLKQRFQQLDIWITSYPIDVL